MARTRCCSRRTAKSLVLRVRQRHQAIQPAGRLHVAQALGRRPALSVHRAVQRRRAARRLHLQGRSRRQELGAVERRLSQSLRRRLQSPRRSVHLRLRHGMGHEHALVSADACHDGGQRQRFRLPQRLQCRRRRAIPTPCPRSVDIGPGSPTGVSFGYGAKFPAKYQEALLHLRLELRPLVRRPPHARRQRLQGAGRGVRHRLAAGADRYRRQSEGRRHSISPSAAATRSRRCIASPTSARNPPRRPRATTPAPSARPCGTSWKPFTARPIRKAVETAWPYLATRTATSASPPASPSSTRILQRVAGSRALKETNPVAAINALCSPWRGAGRRRHEAAHARPRSTARLGEAERRQRAICCVFTRLLFSRWASPMTRRGIVSCKRFEPFSRQKLRGQCRPVPAPGLPRSARRRRQSAETASPRRRRRRSKWSTSSRCASSRPAGRWPNARNTSRGSRRRRTIRAARRSSNPSQRSKLPRREP